MSDTGTKTKRHVYFWEDHQFKNLRESTVGRKGLSLFELKDMDIPIPEFFVVSSDVFDMVISHTLERDIEKLLEKGKNPEEDEVSRSISKSEIGKDIEEEILTAYTRISGFTDAWVSVRSSVVFPSQPDVSFSGIFATELNVRGINSVLESIKKIYSSFFTDDVVAYASGKGVNLSDVKLSVVIQKMVQAEVSGVAFTVDPITQDPTKLSIEAVFGLGDTIALGELTPDTYLLNKKDLSLIEKHISPQEWMKVRTMGRGSSKEGVEKIKISNNWSHIQKLEDKYLKEISKIALIVESKARKAQSLEWVLAGGRVWVLQGKDLYEKSMISEVSVVNDSKDFDTLGEVIKLLSEKFTGIGLIEGKALEHARKIVNSNKHEYDRTTERLINAAKEKTVTLEKNSMLNKENLVTTGIGASFGTVSGKVLVVTGNENIEVTKNDILVIKKDNSEMESLIVKAGGVIMDMGGITSDTAIICREFNIPAVVGTGSASLVLRNGDIVRVDGNSGSVYKETDAAIIRSLQNEKQNVEVHPVVEAYKEENLSGIDLLKGEPEVTKKEETEVVSEIVAQEIKIPHDMSLSPSATKVFLSSDLEPSKLIDYVGNSHGIVYIDLDRIMLEEERHLLAYVDDNRFVEYSKSLAEKVCKYIELAEGNQVILSIGSQKVGEFRALIKGSKYENSDLGDSVYGLTRYLANKDYLTRVLKILRRIRNVYKKRNVDIAVHSPMNGTLMKEFKKCLSANGLRRTSSFRVYAVLDSPSEVILTDDILDAKIDGLILNMPRVVRVMQGFDMDNTKARYDLGVNSAFKIVDTVVDIARPYDKQIIIVAENNKALIKYSVAKGVYGVSVFAEDIKEARKLVSEEEARVILNSK